MNRLTSPVRSSCLLCAGPADVRPTAVGRVIVCCPTCRTFVMDERFAEVVANVRRRGLSPILDRLPLLSGATRGTDLEGTTARITSTNWVALAAKARPIVPVAGCSEVA